jgi:S-DNA-T family DNA segregation ATPase FtsK/SpoIIIE
MAQKRKKKKKKKQFLIDGRFRRVLGILCLLMAFYFFIAFTSYLFTWKADQDKVLEFSWGLLIEDLSVENWLGRLGAIVSNLFFFWGFGLASYTVIVILGIIGTHLIRLQKIRTLTPHIFPLILLMLYLSVSFEFIMGEDAFSWGGTFGQYISGWLTNFVGIVGVILLLFILPLTLIILIYNPNLENLPINRYLKGFKLPSFSLPEITWGTESGSSDTKTKRRKSINPRDEQFVDDLSILDEQKEYEKAVQKESKQSKLAFDLSDSIKKTVKKKAPEEAPDLEIAAETEAAVLETSSHSMVNNLTAGDDKHIGLDQNYNPALDLSSYENPPLELLIKHGKNNIEVNRAELERNKDLIIETLSHYKVEIEKIRATIGPTVTLYEIIPVKGVRISKIKNLEDDIALSLAALDIRIIAPIPGKGTIGIEVPNKNKQIVSLRDVIASDKYQNANMDLPIALGKTISNEVFVADLARMPHLLIAGATGQGKSVGINTILMSLLYKKHPSQLKLVLIDPKKVELFPYSKIDKHFLASLPDLEEPIVTDTTKVVHTLNSLIIEMEDRYNLLKKAATRNIREYNKKFTDRKLNPLNGHRFMPFIVLVIDEFADLIMTAGKEVELPIGRLAQLARAVGIHLIIATQRPSVNIITGVIKANFPARLAFRVTAKVDSRTILDTGGADRLIGRGDMLLAFGSDIIRLQCAFVDTPELEEVLDFIGNQPGYPSTFALPEYQGDDAPTGVDGISAKDLDEMFIDAARLVVSNQHGSTSMIQRKLKLGYNRAGRIMDQLEAFGVVGPSAGSKPREVLIYDEMELESHVSTVLSKN